MKNFTAELDQVFGIAPSFDTGLEIDTFDGAGLDGGARACGTCRAGIAGEVGGSVGRPTICRPTVCRASVCRASVCATSGGSEGVNMCRDSVPA